MASLKELIDSMKEYDDNYELYSCLEREMTQENIIKDCAAKCGKDVVNEKIKNAMEHDVFYETIVDKKDVIKLHLYKQIMIEDGSGNSGHGGGHGDSHDQENERGIRMRPKTYSLWMQVRQCVDRMMDIKMAGEDTHDGDNNMSKLVESVRSMAEQCNNVFVQEMFRSETSIKVTLYKLSLELKDKIKTTPNKMSKQS